MVEGHPTRHDPHRGRHFRPQRLHADKACDRADVRRRLRGKRIGVRIAREGIGPANDWGAADGSLSAPCPGCPATAASAPLRTRPPQLPFLSRTRRRPVLLQATRPRHHVGHGLSSSWSRKPYTYDFADDLTE